MADQMARRSPARIMAGVLGPATALLVLLAAGSVQAATVSVAAMDFQFQPASRTVVVGDVVRWTFAGDPHTVTSGSPGSPDGRFDSGIQDPGGSFQSTFVTAGTFRYFCQIHPEQMFGTIVVTAAASASPTVRPSARPTARPTVTPPSTPTAAPTPTPPPTVAPTSTPTPEPTPTPTLTSTPVASVLASPSEALLETRLPSSAPASADPGGAAPGSGIDPASIVAVLAVLGALVAGGLVLARRRRIS